MADAGLVELRFDGQRYGFWQSVEIRSSVDDLCDSVRLAVTQPGAGSALGMTINTVAQVLVDGVVASTVRPDVVHRAVGADSHTVAVEARSLGRELVDCQYSKTLSGLRLGDIVKQLCSTFKVPVKIDAETAVVPDFSMQCELPANALINAARAANLLLYSTPDGGLLLTQPTSSQAVATLEYGVHFTRYELVDEFKVRFSDYTVKGFDYAGGAALKGAVQDGGIGFFRPMHIIADKHGQSVGGCDRRAQLERNRRLARAHRIELEVPLWSYVNPDGKVALWAVNTQVRVIIPQEGIDEVFLIGARTWRRDDKGGSVTQLQVMHRNAFAGEEPKKAKRGSGVKKGRK